MTEDSEDYKPDTGPFFAQKDDDGWIILGEEDDTHWFILFNGLPRREMAVGFVDRLHQVIDRWTEKTKGEK